LLQCVAVCCSVLQCVAVCCSVLQYVAVCQESVTITNNVNVLQGEGVAVCCSVLQCVAVVAVCCSCCSMLQLLQCGIICCSVYLLSNTLQHTAARCNTLQHTATHTATHWVNNLLTIYLPQTKLLNVFCVCWVLLRFKREGTYSFINP